MREILFKGIVKDADDKLWVKGGFYKYGDTAWILKANECLFSSMEHWQVIPETVCQYTGLKDKNGRKIFEGDILQDNTIDEWKGIVVSDIWNCSCCYGVYGWGIKGISSDDDTVDLRSYDDSIVIGNIFDNPELLEV